MNKTLIQNDLPHIAEDEVQSDAPPSGGHPDALWSRLRQAPKGLAQERPELGLEIQGGAVSVPIAVEGLQIVLGHRLRNAAENGAQRVCLRAASASNAMVRIDVENDGADISPGNAGRILETFFTSRRAMGATDPPGHKISPDLRPCRPVETKTPRSGPDITVAQRRKPSADGQRSLSPSMKISTRRSTCSVQPGSG
jgi:hypothetical protein